MNVATLAIAVFGATSLPAPVTEVTVYSDRARVTRTANLVIDGPTSIELPLLPRGTDVDSVRVETSGQAARIERVDVTPVRDADLAAGQAEALRVAGIGVEHAIALARFEGGAIERAAALATRPPLTDAPDGAPSIPATASWTTLFEHLDRWTDKLDQRRAAVNSRLARLVEQRAELTETERQARGDVGRIRVVVYLSGQGPAPLRTSYIVSGATWVPRYDLVLGEGDQVTLAMSAVVSQSTQEDWPGAIITASTAAAGSTSVAPVMRRWTIGEAERFVPSMEIVDQTPPPPSSAPARSQQALTPGFTKSDEEFVDKLPQGSPAPGVLLATVLDQTGMPIKGVKLAISGLQKRSTYSNDEGIAQFSGLPAGNYDLMATAPRMGSVIQKGIRVTKESGTEAVVIMEVEQESEEVKLIEVAPVVSTATSNPVSSFGDLVVRGHGGSSRTGDLVAIAPPEAARGPRYALSFASPAREDLPSGSSNRKVALASWRFPVPVTRRLIPALRGEAFLTAALRSPMPVPLPPGRAMLFAAAEPVGEANLPLVRPGQSITLPLGSDQAVRAIRHVRLESSDRGLLRRETVNRYTVTLEVTNAHRRAVPVQVIDQIPKAGGDDITVELIGTIPRATIDGSTGLVTWTTTLAGKTTARFQLVYALSRPKGHLLRQ